MEKMIRLLLILSLLLLPLCGCYRQTTVILPQGQTLPVATDTTAAATISSPTEEASTSEETTQKHEHKPHSSKPAKPQEPATTTNPPETTVPVETGTTVPPTEPVQTAASVETTTPAAPLEHPVYDISNHSIGSYARALLEEINRYRSGAGLSELTMSRKLSALAAIRAYECSKKFSHTRPDGRGWETVLSDYSAAAATENILYATSGTAATLLIDACMGSDNHRQKLMNTDYRSVGIGFFDTGRHVFVVMLFL